MPRKQYAPTNIFVKGSQISTLTTFHILLAWYEGNNYKQIHEELVELAQSKIDTEKYHRVAKGLKLEFGDLSKNKITVIDPESISNHINKIYSWLLTGRSGSSIRKHLYRPISDTVPVPDEISESEISTLADYIESQLTQLACEEDFDYFYQHHSIYYMVAFSTDNAKIIDIGRKRSLQSARTTLGGELADAMTERSRQFGVIQPRELFPHMILMLALNTYVQRFSRFLDANRAPEDSLLSMSLLLVTLEFLYKERPMKKPKAIRNADISMEQYNQLNDRISAIAKLLSRYAINRNLNTKEVKRLLRSRSIWEQINQTWN